MSTITLVSMVPSGEAFITRDGTGHLRLHKPIGAGGAGGIDEETAAQAAKHGFEPVNRSFEDWAELDAFRQAKAGEATPPTIVDRDALGLDEVRGLFGTARRWAGEGEGARARRLVLNLLRVPAVMGDAETHEELVAFLGELGEPSPVLPRSPVSDVGERAREIWRPVLNAA